MSSMATAPKLTVRNCSDLMDIIGLLQVGSRKCLLNILSLSPVSINLATVNKARDVLTIEILTP